jgi:hypothetical protein
MRKNVYLLSAFAAATMMLASCSNEDVTSTVADGQLVDVQFVASLDSHTTSRSVAEGDNINKITYAVYLGDYTKSDFAGTPLALFSDGATSNTADMSGLTTTVPLKLAKGKTYSIVFWAYHNDATAGSPYTFDAENGNISVSYTDAVANDDTRDAFFAVKTFYVSDALVPTVTLYRPFAQINLATNDLAEYKASYEEVTQSYVKIANVGNKLNFFGSTAVEGTETATFALADIPDKTNDGTPISDYDYLAYAYILPSSTVDVTYGVEKDTDIQTVTSVPAKANYRTNIYGSLLTNQVDIAVTVSPAFYEPGETVEVKTVANAAALSNAIAEAQDGDNIALATDLDLTTEGIPAIDKDITIVVPVGKTITVSSGTVSSGVRSRSTTTNKNIIINTGASLTLAGGGTVKGPKTLIDNYGELIVNNMKFEATLTTDGSTIYNNPGGTITFNDGTITAGYYGIENDGGTVTMNGGKITAKHTGIHVTDATLIMNGGKIVASTYNSTYNTYCVVLEANKTKNVLEMNGGELEAARIALAVYSGNATLNKGYITSTTPAAVTGYAVAVNGASADMTINEGVQVVATRGALTIQAGKLTVNGGEFVTNDATGSGDPYYALWLCAGKAYINGGYFYSSHSAVNRDPEDSVSNYTITGGVFNNDAFGVLSELVGDRLKSISETYNGRAYAYTVEAPAAE